MYNMYDEEEEGERDSNNEKVEEQARIKEKINHLKNKMVNLSVSKKVNLPARVHNANWNNYWFRLPFESKNQVQLLEKSTIANGFNFYCEILLWDFTGCHPV